MSTVALNSNVASLNALRRLGESTGKLGQSYERLSSGLRINRAGDDAAGLAIAESLKTDQKLYYSAMRNINDAVSVVSIISSALSEQSSILTRLSELAEQSANGVLGDSQRVALQKEYSQLIDEYRRISASTSFNDLDLLLGGRGNSVSLQFQSGITSSQHDRLTLSTPDLGAYSGAVGIRGDYNHDADVDTADLIAFGAVPASIDALYDQTGGALIHEQVTDSNGVVHNVYITLGVANFGTTTFDDGQAVTSMVQKTWELTSAGTFATVGSGGVNVSGITTFSYTFSGGATGSVLIDTSALTLSTIYEPGDVRKTALEFTGVETRIRALDALDTVANARDDIGIVQGQIGAMESRLAYQLSLASSARETSALAESQIRDVDVAAESANLVKRGILQQAGSAVLVQANQLPELALALLRGA